jgi:hypothetical protein
MFQKPYMKKLPVELESDKKALTMADQLILGNMTETQYPLIFGHCTLPFTHRALDGYGLHDFSPMA